MEKIAINKVSERPEQEYVKAAKKVLLGNQRPPLFTRVILIVALVCVGYYFLWNGLRVVALSNIDSFDSAREASEFKISIQEFGEKFGIKNGLETFKNYGLAMLIASGLALAAMAIIYRRKIFGYYVFFVAMLGMLVTPFVLLSWDYATSEVDFYDYIVPPALAAIFYVSFKRLKKLKEEARLAKL